MINTEVVEISLGKYTFTAQPPCHSPVAPLKTCEVALGVNEGEFAMETAWARKLAMWNTHHLKGTVAGV
jgi:hypothetical protein